MNNIKLQIEDNTTYQGYEVQDLIVGNIITSNALFDSTGKIEFELLKSDSYKLANGNSVSLYIDGKGYFKGFIFKFSFTEKNTIKVTCYNQLRYLKIKDTIQSSITTLSEFFETICKTYNIKYKIENSSSIKIPAQVYSNKSLYEMLIDMIDRTLATGGKWYAIINDFDTLKLVDIEQLQGNVVIGDDSSANSYQYEKSIDNDTYNQVKLIKENKDAGKRDIYIVKDSSSINKWGLLQYHEEINEDMNEQQIKERAEMLLKVKNRETQTLKITALGDFNVDVGKSVMIQIKELELYNVSNKVYIVTNCTHKITNSSHTMDLTLQLGV